MDMKKITKRAVAVLMAMLLLLMPLSVASTAQEAYIEILNGADDVTFTVVELIDLYDYWIYPYDNGETVTWTVEDESVMCVDEENGVVRPVAPGTTTVTATTDTGLSDTVTVTVTPPEAWGDIGTKQLIFKEEYSFRVFSYTPSQTGEYTLYWDGAGAVLAELYDENYMYIDIIGYALTGELCVLPMTLTAGKTYYFNIGAYEPTITKMTLKQGIETACTSFDFAVDTLVVNMGDVFIPEIVYEPETAVLEDGDIVSANESIVALSDIGFLAQSVGTTTLTATASDGSCATMTVIVQEPPVLTADTVFDVDFANGVMMHTYPIYADETMIHVIRSFDVDMVYAFLINPSGNISCETMTPYGDLVMEMEFTQGDVWALCVLNMDGIDKSFEMSLAKSTVHEGLTDISLAFDPYTVQKQEGNDVWVTVDSYAYFDVVFRGSIGMIPETYDVIVENEDIVENDWHTDELYAKAVGTTTVTIRTDHSGISCTYTIHVIEELNGDINIDGTVNIADAVLLFRYANGRVLVEKSTAAQFDINNDDTANIADAVMLFRYANGRLSSLD